VGGFRSLGLCVNVRNTDVNYAVSPGSPKASDQDVARVFRAIVLKQALDCWALLLVKGYFLALQHDWCGFLVCCELQREKRPLKQGCSAHLGKERMETGPRGLPEIAPATSELFTGWQVLGGILYRTPQRQKPGYLQLPVLDRVSYQQLPQVSISGLSLLSSTFPIFGSNVVQSQVDHFVTFWYLMYVA
jgi:hypothetical protein